VATLLQKWVYENVRKSYAANADNALAVLDSKAGDCTEHALLFVALARALDVPAREVGGLGFASEAKPIFAWHAWAEIHDGSQWVTVDPTWNQTYVDATHIKFSEGSDDFAWVNVAGKLKMKVVKFETKKQ
jgi:transglutaminase-like putative cysteine protease